jgi:hypothetical protein
MPHEASGATRASHASSRRRPTGGTGRPVHAAVSRAAGAERPPRAGREDQGAQITNTEAMVGFSNMLAIWTDQPVGWPLNGGMVWDWNVLTTGVAR